MYTRLYSIDSLLLCHNRKSCTSCKVDHTVLKIDLFIYDYDADSDALAKFEIPRKFTVEFSPRKTRLGLGSKNLLFPIN